MIPIESMTPEQIVRELAEAMGYDMSRIFDVMLDGTIWMMNIDDEYETTWNPLTDANDRDMLVEAMRKKGWCLGLTYMWLSDVEAEFTSMGVSLTAFPKYFTISSTKDTVGMAVCLAALKSLRAMKETPDAK